MWNEVPDFFPASHTNTIWLPLNYCLDICLLEKWMFCHLLDHKSIIRKSNTCENFLLPRLVREVLLCKKKSFLKVDWPFDSYTFLPDVTHCTCIHFLWFRIQCLTVLEFFSSWQSFQPAVLTLRKKMLAFLDLALYIFRHPIFLQVSVLSKKKIPE